MSITVTIIVPCYNEEDTIGFLLNAISEQTFPRDEMEVIIADGFSTDRTRAVIQSFRSKQLGLKILIVDNPRRSIPAGLNSAVSHASGHIIIRLDAHSIPRPDYVTLCVENLKATKAANVGGAWEIRSPRDHWISRSIAVAAGHPLGAGNARYRYRGARGEAHTVPFGAFSKEWMDRVGPYNETLLSNEDYEYNYRIRKAGGKIWYDPAIQSIYFSRSTFRALAKQYARYGFWKAMMLVNHPQSIRWRQVLPALFTFTLILLALLSIFPPIGLLGLSRPALGIYLGIYGAITIFFGFIEAGRKRNAWLVIGFPVALWLMHIAWGLGFLGALFTAPFRRSLG